MDVPEPPAQPAEPPPRSAPRVPNRWVRLLARAADAVLLTAVLGALALRCSVPATAPLADENPTSTAFIDLRRAEAQAAGKPFTLRWQWRPLGAISRYLRAAVIYAEDDNFYRHDGVDWRAIEHAVSADWNKGAMSVGGSTITQQLAKNLYLSPRRSLVRKLREVLIAFALEDHLTKQRILELYLNVVEWGDGVFGAEAAARTWFHHPAQSLTPAEAVRLAVALPNPITRAPTVRDAELTRKAVRLIRLMRMQGLLDASEERTALDEVGAPGEQVLPDHASSAAATPPAAHEPSGSPAEPPAPHGPPAAEPPGSEPPADSRTEPAPIEPGDPSRAQPSSQPSSEERPANAPPAQPAVAPDREPTPNAGSSGAT